jgi:tetratricopeptide (TPR) repeat protein
MTGTQPNSKEASGTGGHLRWIQDIIFGITCAVVVGIFVRGAQPGYLDLISPNAGDSYYNLLVQGFRHGQLNVDRDPPAGLASLVNPYDPAANTPFVWDSQHLCFDMSYYKGKLYLYFGVTPALMLFWPYVALTGHYLTQEDAVVIFFMAGFLTSAGLLHAIWRRYFPEVSIWAAASGVIVMGLVTGILELLASCGVYETAQCCGFAFTMFALAGVWKALHEPKRKTRWLILASLAYGLALASRQSLLFGAIMLLAPAAQAWFKTNDPHSRRSAALLLVPTVVPITLVGIGLMLYNGLRFGNPLEFGWHYQLVGDIQNTTARQLSPAYLWINFRFYFLEPMRWTSQFPFLQAFQLSPLPSGYAGVGMPYSGILVDYPIAWLALAAPLALRRAAGKDVSPLRWFAAAVFALFLACALVICLFLFASSSYEFDFLPDLMLLSAVGIFGLERALEHSTARRWIVRGIWSLLLVYSILFNIFSSIESHAKDDYLAGNSFYSLGRLDEAMIQYQKALSLWPELDGARGGVANVLFQKGRVSEAISEYQKALEIKADFPEAHYNLGYCYVQVGRLDDAIAQYQIAVELRPDSAAYHNALGNALSRAGQTDEAVLEYQKALKIKPDYAEADNNLAYTLLQNGRVSEAIAYFQQAVKIGKSYEAYYNLGYAYHLNGMAKEATDCYRQALELQPQFMPAQTGLAWILATWPDASIRNGNEAIALAEKANEPAKGTNSKILRTLAAAYAEEGRFPEAIAAAKQALPLASAQSNLANELQAEIQLYQKNSPLRTTGN